MATEASWRRLLVSRDFRFRDSIKKLQKREQQQLLPETSIFCNTGQKSEIARSGCGRLQVEIYMSNIMKILTGHRKVVPGAGGDNQAPVL